MLAARSYFEQPLSQAVTLRGGADATLDVYDLRINADDDEAQRRARESYYRPKNELALGAHVDAVIHAAEPWEVTVGARFDVFKSVQPRPSNLHSVLGQVPPTKSATVPSFDPRMLSRLRLSKAVSLVSTIGVSHQPPAFVVPIPGLQLGNLSAGLQTSVQTSQGLEVTLPYAFTLVSTAFYHRYLGLSDFVTTCGINGSAGVTDGSVTDCVDQRVKGRTLGLEVLLRRPLTKQLTGWISYTLSRSTRETRTTSYDLGNETPIPSAYTSIPQVTTYNEIPSEFDRTHVLNVIGAYDLGRGWRAGARFYYYSGRPYSARLFGVPVPPFNQERFPDFHRFDARVEKTWRWGEKAKVSVVFEWLNATLRKEATTVTCGENVGPQSTLAEAKDCQFEFIGPVTMPSLGVEGIF
jgi:hypothetical protein